MSGSVSFERKKNSKVPYIDSAGEDDLSPITDAEDLYYVSKSSESDEKATASGQPGKKKGKVKTKNKEKKKDKEKAKKSGGEKQVRY